MTEEEKSRIQEIINLAFEIDLWNIELPTIPNSRGSNEEITPFEITGALRDYVEIQSEIDNIERKTTYEEVIKFLETHNGKLMRSCISSGREKNLKINEMTQEQQDEVNLYARWIRSQEKKILKEYEGRPIEDIPEEYREKIAKLRSLIIKTKTVYEEVIAFLETHNGQLMHSQFWENGQVLKAKEMSQEQLDEINLCGRWKRSQEKVMLKKYSGQPIENVPEEYREKIAKLRELGLETVKSKLSQAKQQRDEAKEKNQKAKELKHQIESQLEKRGKTHEE